MHVAVAVARFLFSLLYITSISYFCDVAGIEEPTIHGRATEEIVTASGKMIMLDRLLARLQVGQTNTHMHVDIHINSLAQIDQLTNGYIDTLDDELDHMKSTQIPLFPA